MDHKNTWRAVLLGAILCFPATGALAQDGREIEGQKLAQTGLKFLSQSVDARAAALGTATAALEDMGATALFYNPASMARGEHTVDVWMGRSQWIADINYNAAGVAFRPEDGRYGVVGLSVMAVDYGEILSTIRTNNDQGFVDTGTYSPTALAVGVGYAKRITDRFDVGGHVKYATQDLGASTISTSDAGTVREERTASTLAYDFGVLYRTGFRSMTFAVNVRNFSREIVYVEESFELPLNVSVGFAIDAFQLANRSSDMHAFLITTEMSHPRDYDEQVSLGGEYRFMNILALRAGYVFPADEHGVSLGAGVQTGLGRTHAAFDYAYTPFGLLGNVNRLSLALSI